MIVGWIDEADTAELRALEYWERGHRHETPLFVRVIGELAKRGAKPHWRNRQRPGIRGAIAALRRERAGHSQFG